MEKHIALYYFTGTGNTLIACRKLKEKLENLDHTVTLHPIERSDGAKIPQHATIGLAFPVAVFSTYPLVKRFISLMRDGNNQEIFMLSTMAGSSWNMPAAIRTLVTNKGYLPIGAREFIMPSNFISVKSDDENRKCIDKAFTEIETYAEDLHNGNAQWQKALLLPHLCSWIASRKAPWRMMSRMIKINTQRCTRCGLCAQLCPVANIVMDDYPHFGNRCEVCMRCVSFCPEKAIIIKSEDTKTYKGVSAKEILG